MTLTADGPWAKSISFAKQVGVTIAICKVTVLYVLRTLVNNNITLNAGSINLCAL
ncbi:MAG: hypothetical protein V7776_23375 [Halopseudomonas aestusnigri]